MAARLGIGADGDRARAQRKALLGEDDATTVFETSKEVTVITTFDQMSLKEDLLRGNRKLQQSHISKKPESL